MRKRIAVITTLLFGAIILVNPSHANLLQEEPPVEKLAPRAIIHQSGGTVAQPYVRDHVAPVREEATVVNAALDRHHRVFKLHRRLQKEGVQLIRVGEELTLVLPSSDHFYARSPRLFTTETVKKRLWLIASYLNCFDKIAVNVAVYTSNQGSMQRNRVLSQQRADAVADMLNRYNTDARLIFAKGFGASYPIASNKTTHGQMMNERVEISIRMLPPESLVRQTAW